MDGYHKLTKVNVPSCFDVILLVKRKLISPKRIKFTFPIILIPILLYCFVQRMYYVPTISYYEIIDHNAKITTPTTKTFNGQLVKHILLWTPFFNLRNWKLAAENVQVLDEKFMSDNQCPYTNCIITNNREYLSNVYEFDAIVFHGGHVRQPLTPTPKVRSAHQKYVMAMVEPPSRTGHLFSLDRNYFNWTMTYRFDSDILWPYTKIIDIATNTIVAPSPNPSWREFDNNFYDARLHWMAVNKTKHSVWFVSHCGAHSRRDDLVDVMKKYVDVDVYGKCGSLSCSNKEKCNQLIDNDYKFYLAFENTLCLDYVTEKVFDNLNRNIIPVVYGGADYTKFIPPHSYIDANQFNTVKALTDYMIYLDENPSEYIKYFWWKKHYKLIDFTFGAFCELCGRLNRPNIQQKLEVYNDIERWFDTCFLDTKIQLI